MKAIKLGTTAIASVFALSFAALPLAAQTAGDPGSPPYQQQLAPQDRGGPAQPPAAAEQPVPPAPGQPPAAAVPPADPGMTGEAEPLPGEPTTGAAEPLPGETAPDGAGRTVPPGADDPAIHGGGGAGGN